MELDGQIDFRVFVVCFVVEWWWDRITVKVIANTSFENTNDYRSGCQTSTELLFVASERVTCHGFL